MLQFAILLATFASTLILSALALGYITSRREVQIRLGQAASADSTSGPIPEDLRGLPVAEAELVRNYFTVVRADKNPNSLQNRLIRAGYFSASAPRIFQLIRILVAGITFAVTLVLLGWAKPEMARGYQLLAVFVATAFAFFLCNVMLERRGDKREIEYRKLFPDFMDTLIVCVDSGMSIEAAIDRVTKEFLKSRSKDFGLHLAIMMLEVRGGRRLRDALSLFAKRLRIEEAHALAVLFRQSEELGASVTKTLRVFSQEMREKRMIRAEEKANALPFKMLLPLAGFLFPISVLIVLVPILMRVVALLKSLS
ncbi:MULTISPECIES: type II secretion system F family protein [Aminobacter]|uniref:Pilus assembly protein TadC n=2 Tax=Aminobacter TaxID=31988 RepID=A0AAC8YJ51_AMIAI|nr:MULTISPECIES: type II secretion system F family protein [Aminobacter]AMS39320.1 pilus assembly protein TadC [Aminobacter aminovorans]MBA8910199.1 tight adherence protein C [Aminobacter ciceronei]MBA9023977.1 tight adherence protein C [Aminobacter ciceronei]MBB3709932.1 tight adherence protein C [Aminobacter aminovorans]WMC97409.1 type II secretion system F family protein [Aminobacter aminovorans]